MLLEKIFFLAFERHVLLLLKDTYFLSKVLAKHLTFYLKNKYFLE